ncbi:hypothetical protein HQ865_04045 [Mucilaginibacter mali]|uniref:Uncharacterized protein n=1 Tax=Mucilaginibacter mali TaxID=2740462 RepID=A0A7D4TVY7_9SPHI|nr:hypothetical protein [Mucilaginibacter mali]QKJ28957.1 hypothetical protein HQ865_04045 [Mucilaginibacter mali]
MKNLLKATAMLLLFFAVDCKAQGNMVTDINGRPYRTKAYDDIEGSPYLYDAWMPGTVKMNYGSVYTNISLKLNEQEGKLYFKGKNDEVLEFVDPVTEFTLNGMHFIAEAGTFYQVLADGSTKLLKQPVKEIQETKTYGSAVASKTFIAADKYFVMSNGKLTAVKKDKKAILAALAGKQAEVEAYMKKESLNFKNDADLAKLFIYYNSL